MSFIRPISIEEGVYENQYSISSKGTIINTKFRRVLKSELLWNGYEKVRLSKKGKTKAYRIHVLVAHEFLGPKPKGMQVNHKNGNKLDNRIENLEYLTAQQNVAHAIESGLISNRLKQEVKNEIRNRYIPGKHGLKKLAKEYGVHPNAIRHILKMEGVKT